MVQYGMPAPDVLRADLLHGADLLGWKGQLGELKPGYLADVIAVDGNPLTDIGTLRSVSFVMKGGVVFKQGGAPVTESTAAPMGLAGESK